MRLLHLFLPALLVLSCSSSKESPETAAVGDTSAAETSLGDAETDAGTLADAGVDTTADAVTEAPDVAVDSAPAGTDAVTKDVPTDTGPPKPVYTFAAAACGQTPPADAILPAKPKAYTGGTCPKLIADGKTLNPLQSQGNARSFIVVAPSDIKPDEKLPVLFAYYWLKASPNSFIEKGELVAATQAQRFIAIVPESKKDITIPFTKTNLPWPMLGTITPDARFQEEHVFFDDMLACVAEQFPIDNNCVAVTGVSAGALYTAQLVSQRSEYISSYISLSGGIQTPALPDSVLATWTPPKIPRPMLILWGGPTDSCVLLSFQAGSQQLETAEDTAGAFVTECVHNCAHGVPPIDTPPGKSKFAVVWEFAWSHPFWLKTGESPWAKGLPADAPAWCGIGSNSATIRTGACDPPGCPF